MSKAYFQVAIDGPVAAGKTTVASELAKRMGYLYVYTGAMYRALALAAKEAKVNWNDEAELVTLLTRTNIQLECPGSRVRDGRKVTVRLDGRDVSLEILKAECGEGASVIGQYKKVRQELVKRQRQMCQKRAVVMEGRDIGVRVLPEADLKIFLTADLATRIKRKKEQAELIGQKLTTREIKRDIGQRDRREMTRKIDPLQPVPEAWILDTTNLSTEGVVRKIIKRIEEIKSGEGEK